MKILFVCTGNTCRSPMAQALYNKLTYSRDASSAGLMAENGAAASAFTVRAMQEFNAPLDYHRSRQITKADIDESDLIITMTNSHKELLKQTGCGEKIITLYEFASLKGDVSDPFGHDYETYLKTAKEISQLIQTGIGNIRAADKSDIKGIAIMEREIFPDAWSESAIEEYVKKGFIYLAQKGALLLGYIIFMRASDEGEILRIAVKESARKRKTARRLLETAIENMYGAGVKNIYLEVRESNTAARRLYESAKFKEIGRRGGYYRDNNEDALIYNLKNGEEE